MSNQELCTMFELIVALLKSGNSDKAAEILENAIKRIDKGSSDKQDKKDEN